MANKKHISITTMFMATKLFMMLPYCKELPSINLHDFSIRWSCVVAWQSEYFISPTFRGIIDTKLQSWKKHRLVHVLAQFLFTTIELELRYYHQKVNVQVALRVAEGIKTQDCCELGNFKKIPKMLALMTSTEPASQKPNFDVFFGKKL